MPATGSSCAAFRGRIDAKNNPIPELSENAQHRHPELHGRREFGEAPPRQPRQVEPRLATPTAPPATHWMTLSGQELPQNVFLRSAHRAGVTPISCVRSVTLTSMTVHDHDPAHHGGDRAHHHEKPRKGGAHALPKVDIAVGRADEEVLVSLRAHVAAGGAGMIRASFLRALKVIAASAFTCSVRLFAQPAKFQIGIQGITTKLSWSMPITEPIFSNTPMNGEFHAAQANRASHRIEAQEKFAGQVVADQADARRSADLRSG